MAALKLEYQTISALKAIQDQKEKSQARENSQLSAKIVELESQL